jgi:hypothetical protein
MQGVAVRETRKAVKTENLSLRLDPKTKFILDFVVRLKGVRTTDLVARAIKEMADTTTVGTGYEEKNWLDYWHPEEGMRTLNLIFDKQIPTSFDEDEIAGFVRQHWQFFFNTSDLKNPVIVFVQVIWPQIDVYLDHWREHKSADRWATGSLMLQAIKGAGMQGPTWPPRSSTPAPARAPAEDIDDEIPF